jgi:hypothetical protein
MFATGQKSVSITVRYLNALLAEQELLSRFLTRREEAAFETLVRRGGGGHANEMRTNCQNGRRRNSFCQLGLL